MSGLRFLLPVCLAAIACSTSNGVTSNEYFPLELGNAWVYEIALAGQPPEYVLQTLVSGVLDETGGQVFVVSEVDGSLEPGDRRDQPATYQLRDGGIFCLESEAYLLPSSVANGQTWPAGSSEEKGSSRIVSTNASVKALGQRFEGCLIVERNEPQEDRRIEFTFAPGVGLVRSRFFRLSGADAASPYREETLVEFGRITPPRFLRPVQ